MRHLILFTMLLFATNALGGLIGGLDPQDVQSTNRMENGGFENGESRWTESGSSVFSTVTSSPNLAVGSRTASWDATASSEKLTSSDVSVNEGHGSSLCEVGFVYKGADSNISAQVIDGTDAVLVNLPLQTVAEFTRVTTAFLCPASGTVAFQLEASADAAIVYIDDVYMGLQVSSNVATNPIVYNEERSIGTVGAVANGKGALVDGDITFASSAYFPLAGDALNDASIGGDLTVNGSPLQTGIGFFGRENVYKFIEGSTDYLSSTSSSFNLGDADQSFGIWFKITGDTGGDQFIVSQRNATIGWTFFYDESENGLEVRLCGGTVNFTPGAGIDGEWHHVAATCSASSNELIAYLDGQVVGSVIGSGQTTVASPIFTVGLQTPSGVPGEEFIGEVQDLFTTSVTLTAAEVNAIYSKRFSNHTQIAGGHVLTDDSFNRSDLSGGEVLFWNLNSDTNDDSGNGATLTTGGATDFTGLNIFGNAGAATNDGTDLNTLKYDSALIDRDYKFSDLTFGGWVKLDTCDGTTGAAFGIHEGAALGFHFQFDCGNSEVDFNYRTQAGDGDTTVINTALKFSEFDAYGWNHWTVRSDRAKKTLTLFLNGIEVYKYDDVESLRPSNSGTGVFTVLGATDPPVNSLIGRVEQVFFYNGLMSQEDIRRVSAARITRSQSVAVENQDFSASLWGREDGKINNQLDPSWLLDTSSDSLYIDSGLPSGSTINLKMADTGFSATSLAASVYNSGVVSASPTFPVEHGLPGRPLELVVWTEGQTAAGEWDQRRDLCSATATQINCDLSVLVIDGTHRVQVIASMTPGGTGVVCAGSGTDGLLCNADQTVSGEKTFTDGIIAPITSVGNVYSGVGLWTGNDLSNLTSCSYRNMIWSRVGNTVTGHTNLRCTVTTTGSDILFDIPLPVPSAMTSFSHGWGLVIGWNNAADVKDHGVCTAIDSEDELRCILVGTTVPSSQTQFDMNVSFTYLVVP